MPNDSVSNVHGNASKSAKKIATDVAIEDELFVARVADDLMHIETKTIREIHNILHSAELFLRDKWSEASFQPNTALSLDSWFVGLQKNFHFLCETQEAETEWFAGIEKKQSNIPTLMPLVVTISLMLIAFSGPQPLFAERINEAINKCHPAVFMYSIQENDDRLQHTLLAYITAQKLHQMSIPYNMLFLIFLHQIFYKGSVLIDMFKHDLIMVPLMCRTLQLIIADFNGFKMECDRFKNMVSNSVLRLNHVSATTECKLKSATLIIREATNGCEEETSVKNTRVIRLPDKVENLKSEDIDPLQGEFRVDSLVTCFKEFRDLFNGKKVNSIVKYLDRMVGLLETQDGQ